MAQLFANNAVSTLASGITDIATSLTLATGEGALFPATSGGTFVATLYQISGGAEVNHEIINVTARSGDVFTITRAQEGTTGRAFSTGDHVELRLTAAALTALAGTSGTNTGDETTATIKAALGITTLSGSNTGDQTLGGLGAEATANKDVTGGYAGLTQFKINFWNAANTFKSFFTNANTAARTYTFQDRDGTIADLAANIFTGIQTFIASGIRLLGSSTGYTTFASSNASATNYTVTVPAENMTVGFQNVPQSSQSAAYTTVLGDAGKHILHPAADTTARTFTIDSNANVAYPVGTAITIVNQNAGGVVTIAITTDTMRLAGAGTTGSRTLDANGVATALKIATTEWIISGTGLT